jgi:hypothetical protein
LRCASIDSSNLQGNLHDIWRTVARYFRRVLQQGWIRATQILGIGRNSLEFPFKAKGMPWPSPFAGTGGVGPLERLHRVSGIRSACLSVRQPTTHDKGGSEASEAISSGEAGAIECRGMVRNRTKDRDLTDREPYVDRDVSMFQSNDIWVGDGHSFKAKVQHPIHGQPFIPEVTFILDWKSRKIVGWSVSLSESTIAVSDAFRHAQKQTRANNYPFVQNIQFS